MERGNISVSTENIFPIIKKYLYSDHEIFLRELVSNAVDATQKLRHLSSIGEFEGELGELQITVSIDKEAKTLTVSDRGLGMTGEEIKKYLNQVAFSGAEEFLKKYKDAGSQEDIIGKFGLGFYSAFMVAHTVEVVSRSFQADAEAVKWTCDGTTSFSLESSEKEARGTDVILHITEDDTDFLESMRISTILNKYCKFLPVEVMFEGQLINKNAPIWKKTPTDLTDEDYLNFFRVLYPFADEPLFWIHLNVDYPFNLTGVLYFPKIRQDIDPRKNGIHLYSRQVFITDEVGDIVPEYLMLLQGVIDSPDIPLNVSRSYLQSDGNVKKISNYITRKVADKLQEIFKDDRERFEEKWPEISVFVKYGMLTDDKFYERAIDFCLLENMDGKFFTTEAYTELIREKQTDSAETLVHLYTTNKSAQDMYIRAALDKGYDVLHMNGVLDSHLIAMLERKAEKTRWVRVDSDTIDKLIPKADQDADKQVLSEEEIKTVKEAFGKVVQPHMMVQTEALSPTDMPVIITRPEFLRRMKEMQATGGMPMMAGLDETFNVVVNTSHPLVQQMLNQRQKKPLAKQMLDLALLSQHMLEGKELTAFIQRSVNLITKK
jgi:molecular chaperone HtpG